MAKKPTDPDKVAELEARVAEFHKRLEQVDRQSRCAHVWEPNREDPREWICARCGCTDLQRH